MWWLGVRPRAYGAVTLRDRFATTVLVVRARARRGALARVASCALARVGTRSSVAARFVRVAAESRLQSSGALALVVREV